MNEWIKERNLNLCRFEKWNIKTFILAPLGESAIFFLAPLDLKFEIRPLSYIVLCDIHHIKSVLATYYLPECNHFTRYGKQKQKLSDQLLGVLYLMIKPVIVIISLF